MWSAETIRIVAKLPQRGIFLTGIEGSDPVVEGKRRDQLKEARDFYLHYEERLRNIRELGITWLRFGSPYSAIHLGPDHFNFDFTDKVINVCDELGITVMADLLHFGLPDWLHQDHPETPYFQNPYFPTEFARYSAVFAKRYPHIKFYTPVNEPFVTAFLSAKLGLWNEERTGKDWQDDTFFVAAATNIAKAAILARKAIAQVWAEESRDDEPLFVQNESFELAMAMPGSGREAEAHRFNMRRFTLLDLMFGHVDTAMQEYLLSQGMSEASSHWFMAHGTTQQTILGIDHYPWCIHELQATQTVDHDITKPYRLFELIAEYWNRYPLPLLHTEVNGVPGHAEQLCQSTYDVLARLRNEGYPALGMGWYGDELQVGWQVTLRGPKSYDEYPVGLYYQGEKQPVADLFARLATQGLPPFDHRDATLRMKVKAL